MTAQKAKELSLEVWRYLAKHSDIDRKEKLPEELLEKIRECDQRCPLCDLYNAKHFPSGVCKSECPLNRSNCYAPSSFFQQWKKARFKKDRKMYAQKIVETIEAWEPENKAKNIRLCPVCPELKECPHADNRTECWEYDKAMKEAEEK